METINKLPGNVESSSYAENSNDSYFFQGMKQNLPSSRDSIQNFLQEEDSVKGQHPE